MNDLIPKLATRIFDTIGLIPVGAVSGQPGDYVIRETIKTPFLFVVKIDPGQRSAKEFVNPKLADDLKLICKLNASEQVVIDVNRGFVSIQIPLPPGERGQMVYTSANVPRGSGLRVPLGLDIFNEPLYFDFAKQTDTNLSFLGVPGSGKSVSMRRSIVTLARNNQPEDVKFLMIEVSKDALDLRIFSSLPHLVHPVIVDPGEAAKALGWAVSQIRAGKLPYKLIVCIDEVAELVRQQPDTIPLLMTLISQGRAVNVVNLLATQITDKSTMGNDGRAIFRQIHSTVLGKVSDKQLSYLMGRSAKLGGEALTGKGDLMLNSNDATTRFAGVFTTKDDLERLPKAESIPTLPIGDYANTEAIVEDSAEAHWQFQQQMIPETVVSEGLISLQRQMDDREYRQLMTGRKCFVMPASEVKKLGRNYRTFVSQDQPYIVNLYNQLYGKGFRLCDRITRMSQKLLAD